MSAEAPPDGPPSDEPTDSAARDDGRVLPIALGALGILGFAAFVLWPAGDTQRGSGASFADATAAGSRTRGRQTRGIAPREVDAPSSPHAFRSENVTHVSSNTMAIESTPTDEPPAFSTRAEEIDWYEAQLAQAKRMRNARQTFVDRIPRAEDNFRQSAANRDMSVFETRKRIVQDNLTRAQAKVESLEKKLVVLRGA